MPGPLGLLGAQLDREPEGVVEGEQLGAGDARLRRSRCSCLMPLRRVCRNAFSSLTSTAIDLVAALGDLRVVVRVDAGDRRDDLREEVLLQPEVERVPDRPADQPAHHVALGLVARPDAVDGQEGRAAQVVGDDPHGDGLVVVASCRTAPRSLLDDRPQQVDPEHVGAVDRRGRDPGEPAAVVDVLPGQRLEAGLGPLVLHEDRVAELDEPAAVAVLVAVRAVGRVVLDLRVEVEHLGVGAARLADRHVLGLAAAAPPVLLAVERDPGAAGADLGAVLLGAELDLVGARRRPR